MKSEASDVNKERGRPRAKAQGKAAPKPRKAPWEREYENAVQKLDEVPTLTCATVTRGHGLFNLRLRKFRNHF